MDNETRRETYQTYNDHDLLVMLKVEMDGVLQHNEMQNGQIKKFAEALRDLPCHKHALLLQQFEDCIDRFKVTTEKQQEEAEKQSDRAFKLKVAGLTVGIGSGIAVLLWYLNLCFY